MPTFMKASGCEPATTQAMESFDQGHDRVRRPEPIVGLEGILR
jgi:hypothetical protein